MRKFASYAAICAALCLSAACDSDKKTDAKGDAKKGDAKKGDADKGDAKADAKGDAKADAKADGKDDPTAAAGAPPFTHVAWARQEVKDVDAWKAVYDKGEADRAKAGTMMHWLTVDAENPKIVMVTLALQGLDGIKAMVGTPEMKKAFEEAGVVGEPEILMGELKTMSPPPAKDAPKPAGSLFVKHEVADYAAWEKAFLEHDGARKANGFGGYGVMALDGSPNTLAIHLSVLDMDKAKAFAASEELKKVMTDAGVKGAPTMYWSNKLLEEKKYGAPAGDAPADAKADAKADAE